MLLLRFAYLAVLRMFGWLALLIRILRHQVAVPVRTNGFPAGRQPRGHRFDPAQNADAGHGPP